MIQLMVWTSQGVVKWSLVKLRPARDWRAHGSRYWERSGEVNTGTEPRSDRETISVALQAIQDRLGER